MAVRIPAHVEIVLTPTTPEIAERQKRAMAELCLRALRREAAAAAGSGEKGA